MWYVPIYCLDYVHCVFSLRNSTNQVSLQFNYFLIINRARGLYWENIARVLSDRD